MKCLLIDKGVRRLSFEQSTRNNRWKKKKKRNGSKSEAYSIRFTA